jgi:hypothetical protein
MSILSVLEARPDVDSIAFFRMVTKADSIHVGEDYVILLVPLDNKNHLLLTKSSKPVYSFKHLRKLVEVIRNSKVTLETEVNFMPVFHEQVKEMDAALIRLGFVVKGNKYIREAN